MRLYIDIPPDTSRRCTMMTIIPATGVVIIVMIIVGLVTARKGKSHNQREDPDAEEVFYLMFHVGWFTPGSSKTLPNRLTVTYTAIYIKYCRYFSPNNLKKCHQSGIG